MDSSFNSVSSLNLFPTSKAIVVANLTGSEHFIPYGDVQSHMIIIAKNVAAVPIEINLTLLSTGWVLWDGNMVELQPGGLVEFNILKADLLYIMHKIKSQ